MLNKQGQLMLVGLMIMFFIFIVAVILIAPLKEIITLGRTDLNCSNMSNLTTGEASTCLILDLYLPYFIGVVLAASAGYLFYKITAS